MLPDSVILYKSDATFYVKSIKLIDMELPGCYKRQECAIKAV